METRSGLMPYLSHPNIAPSLPNAQITFNEWKWSEQAQDKNLRWKSPIEHTGNGKKGNTKYLIRYKQNVIFFQNSLYLHKYWDVGLSIYIFMYQQYKHMNTHRKRRYVPFYLDLS